MWYSHVGLLRRSPSAAAATYGSYKVFDLYHGWPTATHRWTLTTPLGTTHRWPAATPWATTHRWPAAAHRWPLRWPLTTHRWAPLCAAALTGHELRHQHLQQLRRYLATASRPLGTHPSTGSGSHLTKWIGTNIEWQSWHVVSHYAHNPGMLETKTFLVALPSVS